MTERRMEIARQAASSREPPVRGSLHRYAPRDGAVFGRVRGDAKAPQTGTREGQTLAVRSRTTARKVTELRLEIGGWRAPHGCDRAKGIRAYLWRIGGVLLRRPRAPSRQS